VTLVIGHKGAPAVAAENTIASFKAARALGADGVELDVRRAAGGHLAISHDATLPAPDGRVLLDLPAESLPECMPDLPAVLEACAGLELVNVEIKNWTYDSDFDESLGIADRVVAAIGERPAAERERIIVSCFHLPTVDRVRELDPSLATACLMLGFTTAEAAVAEVAAHGHTAIHPHHSAVDVEVVKRAHDAGLAVNTWTCDDPDRIRWLAEVGVDGIVTNAPDVALTALGRNGSRP
jgi:glycerophosphoryl diester phosphodiesterase